MAPSHTFPPVLRVYFFCVWQDKHKIYHLKTHNSVTLKQVHALCCACVHIPSLARVLVVVLCTLGGGSIGAHSSELWASPSRFFLPPRGMQFRIYLWWVHWGEPNTIGPHFPGVRSLRQNTPGFVLGLLTCLSSREACLPLCPDFLLLLLPVWVRPVQGGQEEALQLCRSGRGCWTLIALGCLRLQQADRDRARAVPGGRKEVIMFPQIPTVQNPVRRLWQNETNAILTVI